MHIAIIGAGIAGLTAANDLRDAGITCTVFEKSRGLGGRMATRRTDSAAFDHGAQYVTARSARFRSLLEHWRNEGTAAEWLPGKWVGTPGMTAPARSLARNLRVVSACRINGITGKPGAWQLAADATTPVSIEPNVFDAVILAMPAPQIVPLATSAGAHFNELDRVHYAPCLTLMLGFDSPVAMHEPFITPADGPLAWIARNNSKPGRASLPDTIVAQATPGWSRAHIDAPIDLITQELLHAVSRHIGSATPTTSMVQRWRYARVEQTAGVACLWDPVYRIGACGDWALGARVECAFDSGAALASAIIGTVTPVAATKQR